MPPLLGPEPARPETERTIEDDALLTDRLDRVEEEKRKALGEPGPSWREWWYFHASKWYILLAFVVAEVWVFVTWVDLGDQGYRLAWAPATLSVVALAYGEFLLYSYLYYRPEASRSSGRKRVHRFSWLQPFAVGRWTPEAALYRSGGAVPENEGPNPEEFL